MSQIGVKDVIFPLLGTHLTLKKLKFDLGSKQINVSPNCTKYGLISASLQQLDLTALFKSPEELI